MNDIKVLTVGGSRNIGYYASLRLLDLGATVTFLLRSPSVFNDDAAIQRHVSSGKARLVKGNALVREDVERAWTEAAKGDDNMPVDFLVFTVGESSPSRLLGLTRASHNNLPLLLKPLYGYLLRDKCGVEEVLAHCAGWPWEERDSPGPEILGANWKERPKSVVVIRPALLTDGECRGDGPVRDKQAYRVNEGDVSGSYTVSRKDVAHFLIEGVVKDWDTWQGKRVSIAY
ncbi:hypothetical protein BKA83DRAFT_30400 [Pisolithus microcarpus]|nr:hypothetical protein BKA83DRAFT_30400 [Pisolithus microcarpus]